MLNKAITSKYAPLAMILLLFLGVSYSISVATGPGTDGWYFTLARSPLTPPPPVFGIVWPILYTLMAFSFWRLWQIRERAGVKTILILFAAHMLLNWSWNFVFFEFHLLLPAFVLLMAILIYACLLMLMIIKVSKPAALFLLPYTVWLSFAAYLSGYIWVIN